MHAAKKNRKVAIIIEKVYTNHYTIIIVHIINRKVYNMDYNFWMINMDYN
jgi:hypothetical protein